MSVLEVKGLCKNYPSFRLSDVSFSLGEGRITGFIGRNGAGKSTTLKSMLGLVHPDAGEVRFFGLPFRGHELEVKRNIAFAAGDAAYYPRKKLRTITEVTKSFYPQWDDGAYRNFIENFGLDEGKTPSQLSSGMKVKYSLALALSHHAKLVILDEPTSGLDPVSRDELLDVFMDLSAQGVTIFFSTHITSDLDKCADDIVFIRSGKIEAAGALEDLLAGYRVAQLAQGALTPELRAKARGVRRIRGGCDALFAAKDAPETGSRAATLEDIMTMTRDRTGAE